MLARTVSVTVATCGYFITMFLFFLGSAIDGSRSPFFKVIWIFSGSTLVLLLAVSVPTVISLRRHPELVKPPSGRPLSASTARLLWVLGGACILLSLGCVIGYRATDSGWFRGVQFVGFIGGLIVFSVFSRRPVQPVAPVPRLSVNLFNTPPPSG